MPIIHAIGACDYTSSLFAHGKKNVFKTLTHTSNIVEFAEVIGLSNVTHEEVANARVPLISCIYGGKPEDNLNQLRHTTYCHLTSTSTHPVLPHRIPPTVNAAKFHI